MSAPCSVKLFEHLSSLLHTQEFQETHRQCPTDFTRQRVLGFTDLVIFQLQGLVLSFNVEIHYSLDLLPSSKSYSRPAFSQTRQKLKHTAFMALNQQLIQDYYTSKSGIDLWKNKFLRLAVDGSLIQLPESQNLLADFSRWKNHTQKGMIMGRAGIIYEVCNRMILKASLVNYAIGERSLFHQQYEQLLENAWFSNFSLLFLMDRGYPCFEFMKKLDLQHHAFVIRCKASFCRAMKQVVQENSAEEMIHLTPRAWDKKGRAKRSIYTEGIDLKVVRILLPSGKYEYLLTNTAFTLQQLSELYQLRWSVETCYSILKEIMQLV